MPLWLKRSTDASNKERQVHGGALNNGKEAGIGGAGVAGGRETNKEVAVVARGKGES